jgi:hypothetical protein
VQDNFAPTDSFVELVQRAVDQPSIQAMILGEACLYVVLGTIVVVGLTALAFRLPQAGQAIRRNYPRVAGWLKIHQLPHPKSAFHMPAE